MGCKTFHFKQFTIRQERCAMKVGTDGVLLGAWAANMVRSYQDQRNRINVLDAGTGSGVMALIVAQLVVQANVTAIEVEHRAAQQAGENAAASKFADRIRVYHQSLQQLAATGSESYDVIVTNPPYFVRSFLPKEEARMKARHNTQLSFGDLIRCVDRLLSNDGLFCLILPFNVSQSFAIEAASKGLHLVRLTAVRDTSEHAAIRHMLMFTRKQWPFKKSGLTLYKKGREERSAAFHALTQALYLQS